MSTHRRLRLVFQPSLAESDPQSFRLLQLGLAEFLDVTPRAVRISPGEADEVYVVLPAEAAERLQAAHLGGNPQLQASVADRVLTDCSEVEATSRELVYPVEAELPLPPRARHRLRCFVSMQYASPHIDPVYDIIESAASAVGLAVYRSDAEGKIAGVLREQVLREIDESLVFVCEGSSFSWFVAFEMAQAHGKKPCVLLVQENQADPTALGVKHIGQSLYAGLRYLSYCLSSRRERSRLLVSLTEALRDAINTLVPGLNAAADALREPARKGAENYQEPRVDWNGRELKAGELFDEWKRSGVGPKPVALVSPSGFGKTEFLAQFNRVLQIRAVSQAETIEHLPRWFLFLDLGDPKNTALTDAWPVNLIHEKIGNLRPSDVRAVEPPGLLIPVRPYLASGMAYVVLDALDEYSLTQGSHVSRLLEHCIKASVQGVQVILSCRKWFWEQRVAKEFTPRFSVAEILGFSDVEAIRFVERKQIPKTIGVYVQERKERVYSPLLLKYLKGIDEARAKLREPATKSRIYDGWISELEQQASSGPDMPADAIDRILTESAVLCAAKRTQYLSQEMLAAAAATAKTRKLTITDRELRSFLDVRQLGDAVSEAKFAHPSLYEFFVAKGLAREFRKALTGEIDESDSALSRVQLDFVTASVYGFMRDSLEHISGEGPYLPRLVTWLSDRVKEDGFPKNEELTRNLVEYVGMTFDVEPSHKRSPDLFNATVEMLLALVEHEPASKDRRQRFGLVRYNAARALERIHPSAPRPYFDYTSDWGGKDFKEFDRYCSRWMIRGAGEQARAPYHGTTMAFAPDKKAPYSLANRVCHRLLDVLKKRDRHRSPASREQMQFLRINCSQTIIRWYQADNKDIDGQIKEIHEQINDALDAKPDMEEVIRQREKMVLDNLEEAKKRSRWHRRNRPADAS